MREHFEQKFSKRKYSKISLQKRVKLVKMVTQGDQPVTKAAKKLSIKLCTARIILKKYKETGQFPMKSSRQRLFARPETSSHSLAPPDPPSAVKPEEEQSSPKDLSFSSSCESVKEETLLYPYWMACHPYYAFLPAQVMPYQF